MHDESESSTDALTDEELLDSSSLASTAVESTNDDEVGFDSSSNKFQNFPLYGVSCTFFIFITRSQSYDDVLINVAGAGCCIWQKPDPNKQAGSAGNVAFFFPSFERYFSQLVSEILFPDSLSSSTLCNFFT